MKPTINLIISDAAHGDVTPLRGLLDYLINEKKVSKERIIKIAFKHFGLPRSITTNTLFEVLP